MGHMPHHTRPDHVSCHLHILADHERAATIQHKPSETSYDNRKCGGQAGKVHYLLASLWPSQPAHRPYQCHDPGQGT